MGLLEQPGSTLETTTLMSDLSLWGMGVLEGTGESESHYHIQLLLLRGRQNSN